MSSRRQATVDKLDRTITRLYTYLSGSEGEEAESASPAQRRPKNQLQQQQQQQQRTSAANTSNRRYHQEPEYQQPYAHPPAHAVPYNPYGHPSNFPVAGQPIDDTPTSEHASSDATFTESELALTHESTLPIANGTNIFNTYFLHNTYNTYSNPPLSSHLISSYNPFISSTLP